MHQDADRIIKLSYPEVLYTVSTAHIRKHITQPMGNSKISKIVIEHISPITYYNNGLYTKVDTRTYLSISYPKGMSRASFIQKIKAHMGANAHAKATASALLVDFPSWLIALKAKSAGWKFADKEYIENIPKQKILPTEIAKKMFSWGLN